MTARRRLSLARLSALRVPPPSLVRWAAAAGFDLVGALRLTPTRDGSGHAMLGESPLRRETMTALADTGTAVLDVEVFRLRAGTDVREAVPLLEAGAELGARYLLCTVEDDDLVRRAQALGALCELGSSYGLTCMVEPMVFSAVRTPREAQDLLRAAGDQDAGVLVDALHLVRAGGGPADVARLAPGLLPYVQLSDAATALPAASREAAVVEAVGLRLAPGDGVLPLRALLDVLPASAAVSVEAPNPAAAEDPAAWFRYLASRTRTLLG